MPRDAAPGAPMSEEAEGGQRRLVAILSMDAVGYSRMMAADEAATVRTLTAYRDEIARLVAEAGGRVVDNPGDNVLCEFPAATSAVACALEIQRTLGELNAPLPSERRLVFRIGVHLGEVLAQGPRIYGDGVNIAARLEGLAEPGGVCVSQAVRDQIGTKLAVAFDDLGEQSVKNIPQAVRVHRVRSAAAGGAASEHALAPRAQQRSRAPLFAVAATVLLLLAGSGWWLVGRSSAPEATSPGFDDRPAIAVLPFDNLSADPEQAFFADGLAEDLITRLSTWRAFPVIARNSSFQYRGGNVDLKRVSQELGVRYVVEGSVRRAGDRIRVAAQLIDAPTGEHVWAETYDREIEDVFALQDEISATIAASLVDDLARAEGERARQRGTENLEAWSLYQLGRQRFDQQTLEDYAEARLLFERAVALDPRFATALAYLALTNLWEVAVGWSDASEPKVEAALGTARRAVELDPRDPVAHAALGWAYIMRGDLKSGLDSAQRAVDLNPSMPEAWAWFGWTQLLAGDPEACIAASERARRLSPQGPTVAQVEDNSALAYFETGRYEAGLEAGRKLVALRPAYVWGYGYVAMNAAALGRVDEARAAAAEARRVQPEVSLELFQRGIGISRPEIDARRNAALREAGLE
jgi:TolB-like protein/class 3 adenylate cyclase/cytochrome c-type biogenesis protein CcmH/NrfG